MFKPQVSIERIRSVYRSGCVHEMQSSLRTSEQFSYRLFHAWNGFRVAARPKMAHFNEIESSERICTIWLYWRNDVSTPNKHRPFPLFALPYHGEFILPFLQQLLGDGQH